jgi:hypothetical protein
MSRNRKNQTAAVRFGPALKALCLCLFVGASGVGYVYQKDQINTLNERRRQCEVRLDQSRRQNERLGRVLAALQSPAELEARIRQLDLGLSAPQPDQVVRLVDAPPPMEPEAPISRSEQWYAAQRTSSLVRR